MTHYTPQNFSMFSGDDKVLRVTVIDDETSAAFDLTGSSAIVWKLAKTVSAPEKISKELSAGILVTDAVNGKLEITLDPEDTDTLFGSFYHELEITDAAGNIRTVMAGVATIDRDLIVPVGP